MNTIEFEQVQLDLIATTEVITPIERHLEMTNKRDFSDAMETEQEGSLETTKKQKTETKGELVEVVKTEGKKKSKEGQRTNL